MAIALVVGSVAGGRLYPPYKTIDSEASYLTVVRSGRPRLVRKQLWPLYADFQRELIRRNLLTFEGVVHQARLAVENGLFPRYRHVLVDELQDFGLEALRLIRALCPTDETLQNLLSMVGDGHQRLYNPLPVPLSRAGIDVRGRARRLKINYRTSEQIRHWSHGLLQGIEVDDLDGGAAAGAATVCRSRRGWTAGGGVGQVVTGAGGSGQS